MNFCLARRFLWNDSKIGQRQYEFRGFEPAGLADLREVSEEITSRPWFNKDPAARKAFVKDRPDAYPGGTFSPLAGNPILEAKAHVGRDRS